MVHSRIRLLILTTNRNQPYLLLNLSQSLQQCSSDRSKTSSKVLQCRNSHNKTTQHLFEIENQRGTHRFHSWDQLDCRHKLYSHFYHRNSRRDRTFCIHSLLHRNSQLGIHIMEAIFYLKRTQCTHLQNPHTYCTALSIAYRGANRLQNTHLGNGSSLGLFYYLSTNHN